jgi:hypothetical protein
MPIMSILYAALLIACIWGGIAELIGAIRFHYPSLIIDGIGILLLGASFAARWMNLPVESSLMIGGIGTLCLLWFRYRYGNDWRSRGISFRQLFFLS